MSDVVTLTIVDALPRSITVNGFTGNQAVATASPPNPLAYTLSGGTTDPDSNLSFVRVALNNGPFQPANNVSGNWSQWSKPFSLPVGLHCFTIQAQDAIGHLTQEVRFLAVESSGAESAAAVQWIDHELDASRAARVRSRHRIELERAPVRSAVDAHPPMAGRRIPRGGCRLSCSRARAGHDRVADTLPPRRAPQPSDCFCASAMIRSRCRSRSWSSVVRVARAMPLMRAC